jgi:hypothetical protein
MPAVAEYVYTFNFLCHYRVGRTHDACGPLSPMVSPKITLSPSDSASIAIFFNAFSWKYISLSSLAVINP